MAGSRAGRTVFVLARVLFGGVLVRMGVENLRNVDDMVAYAEANGVPEADKLVPFASGMLTLGGIGIALWRLPLLAAGAVASFFVGVTPIMHDYWNKEGEARANQQIHFRKNLVMLGGALLFLVLRGRERRAEKAAEETAQSSAGGERGARKRVQKAR